MPFVQVHMWEGRSVDQKRALTKAITEAMVEFAGASAEHLHVVISEYPKTNWALAGKLGIDIAQSSKQTLPK
ncbi:MAG TPA: 2-hydroxymuconate tautomerase [Candidatus Nanopelagicaceae bacterium]